MHAVAIRRESAGHAEVGAAARDEVQHRCTDDATNYLRDDVRKEKGARETTSRPQADRDRRVEVAARDRAERVRAGQYRETKGEGYSEQADSDLWKCCREHRAAATSENKPERAD